MALSSEEISGMRVVWKTHLPLRGQRFESTPFSFLDAEWSLNLSLQLDLYTSLSLYLVLLRKMTVGNDSRPFEITTWIESQIIRNRHLFGRTENITKVFQCIWSISKDDLLEERLEPEDGDDFTVTCILHSVSPSGQKKEAKHQSIQTSLEFPADLQGLSHDFGNFLEKGVMLDVELKCGDSTVPAHRTVLAARSEVFSAMFRNNMAESQTGVVDVPDIDLEVLQLLVKYAYCGQLSDIQQDLLPRLYTASDKYAVQGLKKACSDWMKRGLTEENCLGFLVLADAHSDEDLKDEVVDFITENKKVLDSEAWSRFTDEHSKLANKVYHIYIKKWCSK